MGAGGFGLNACAFAKDMGAAHVISVDKVPEKLKLAKQFGADEVIDANEYPTVESRVAKVKSIAGGTGADVVAEFVASAPEVVAEGLQMLGLGGTFISVGLVGPNVFATVPMAAFIDRGIKLIGSANYKAWTMPQVLDMMSRTIHKYPFDKIISHKFKLEQAEEAMKLAVAGKVVRAAIVND